MNPDWIDDPIAEPVPTDEELVELVWEFETGADDEYQVVVGMAYESSVDAVARSLAIARFLAGDYKCEHDDPVLIAEGTLFDVANDTIATLEAMDLADDLKADLAVARYFLGRWQNDDDVHGHDGDELVNA